MSMTYLELEISGLMEGYHAGMRTDVFYARKCVEEMKALSVKHPDNALIRLRLAEMGETRTYAGTVKSHGAYHVVL